MLETMGIVESFNIVIHVPSLSSVDHLKEVLEVSSLIYTYLTTLIESFNAALVFLPCLPLITLKGTSTVYLLIGLKLLRTKS